jgi:glycosyltransferase involved in cell wall biosynthesis
MDVRTSVFFIVPSMRGGGSERVISIIAQNIDKNQFLPVLVLLNKEGPYLNDLPENLKIIDLEVKKARYAILKIIKLLFFEKPDIIMSTVGHLNIIMAIIKYIMPIKMKFVSRESSIVSINNKHSKYHLILDYLYKKVYNNFDLIISQSKFMKKDLVDNFSIDSDKIVVINNPIDKHKIDIKLQENVIMKKNKINLLCVGSLIKVKNHISLLNAMALLDDTFFLTILGEGELKSYLEKEVVKLKISHKVNFRGFENNPYKYMKESDLLIICSLYEGFPNVALESIYCGTPVVAYKCIGGTQEIIEDGINGWLVECDNFQALATKIIYFSKQNLIKREIKKSAERYDVELQVKKYENEFNKLFF